MRIKIARIITRLDLGGAQQTALYLCRHLDPCLFEQILISGSGGLLFEEAATLPNVRHYVVPELTRHIGPRALGDDFRALIKIRRILLKEAPLIVHTHTPKAGIIGRWAAWLAGIRTIIHTYHGFGFGEGHPALEKWIYGRIEQLTALISSCLVVVARQHLAAAKRLRLFPDRKGRLIRSGVDFSRFDEPTESPAVKKAELGLSPSDKIVGVVASWTPPKAPLLFVEVARLIHRQLPAVKFVMIGDGELRPAIEAKIRTCRLEAFVITPGWRRDILALLRTFDVFLLTSLWEGLPKVLVESSRWGIPAVAFDIDGNAEVIRDGVNGFLVTADRIDEMAQKVISLLTDETLHARMAKQGPSLVEEFSSQLMAESYTNLYGALTHGAG
jgi:glycosyltransferase involved in cell wall biosynthesis